MQEVLLEDVHEPSAYSSSGRASAARVHSAPPAVHGSGPVVGGPWSRPATEAVHISSTFARCTIVPAIVTPEGGCRVPSCSCVGPPDFQAN